MFCRYGFGLITIAKSQPRNQLLTALAGAYAKTLQRGLECSFFACHVGRKIGPGHGRYSLINPHSPDEAKIPRA
jgi:hypothetical protein